MGLFFTKQLPYARLGTWEITESLDELMKQASLSEAEQAYFAQLKSPLRRKHWLSYRLILPHLLEPATASGITYDEYGKPQLENAAAHISVAHSGKYAALILCSGKHVGIDIEAIQPKILKLTHKFLSPQEMEYKFTAHTVESLCLIWCAKEALYKLHGKGGLSFCEHIYIKQFTYTDSGKINGSIKTTEHTRKYTLHYERIEDHLLVYVVA